jgi:DNA mismatch repair protein MutL
VTSGEATDPDRTGRRIVKLPDAVANQIAAGEVVERPAAVVKELVENALDARARTIEIQFERGGCSLIRVSDDGCGMSPEDAALSLERHATSKIRSAEDLIRVSSFGFRGEALPSIASVSRFRLRTRQPEAREGVEIEIHGRSGARQRTCVLSPGTGVIVADLFHNVPARRKFLKTERTEAAHILQVCRLLAVAHPEVGFSLVEDGHEVFRSPPCPDRLERVREIFGKRRARELMLFSAEVNGIRMSGLLGRKEHGRATRSEMITYVNLRPVESRVLKYALIESYHRYLPRGRYPQAFLFLDVSGEEVDVNVHPTKREVRFRNEALMRTSVMQAVLDRLGRDLRPSLEQAEAVEAVSPRDPGVPPEAQAEKPTPALRPEIVPDRRPPFPEPRERPLPTPARAV